MRLLRSHRCYASREVTAYLPAFAYSRCYKLAIPAQFGSPAVLG